MFPGVMNVQNIEQRPIPYFDFDALLLITVSNLRPLGNELENWLGVGTENPQELLFLPQCRLRPLHVLE